MISTPVLEPMRVSVDAPRLVYDGQGRAPPPPASGKRAAPWIIDLNGATPTTLAALITVRSFKGDVRLTNTRATGDK